MDADKKEYVKRLVKHLRESAPVGVHVHVPDEINKSHEYGLNSTVAKYQIEQLLEADGEKYSKYLVCVRSDINYAGMNSLSGYSVADYVPTSLPGDLNHETGIRQIVYARDTKHLSFLDDGIDMYLSVTNTFMNDDKIYYIPRFKAEYNIQLRQLVVVVIVTDGTDVVLLKTNGNNRIADKLTLIQGHVEFSNEIHFMSKAEYMLLSAIRETQEEIVPVIEGDEFPLALDQLPTYSIESRSSFDNLEHLGFVYDARVESVADFLTNVKSGEPDKHTLTSIPIAQYESYKDQLDGWAYSVLKTMASSM